MKQSKRKRDAKVTVETPAEVEVETAAPLAVVAASAPDDNATNSIATYKFAASCTVRDCVPLKTALGDLLGVEGDTVLDVSAIDRIDAAAMQLLYVFVRERKTRGGKVTWVGESPSFTEAVTLLGLASHLDVPKNAGGAV